MEDPRNLQFQPGLATCWLGSPPAPSLAEAQTAGLLPSYDECQAYYVELRTRPTDRSGQ